MFILLIKILCLFVIYELRTSARQFFLRFLSLAKIFDIPFVLRTWFVCSSLTKKNLLRHLLSGVYILAYTPVCSHFLHQVYRSILKIPETKLPLPKGMLLFLKI